MDDVVDVLLACMGRLRQHAAAVWQDLDLTPPLATALRELQEGPRSQRELASGLGYDPSSITGLADKLEERGLVERHVDPDDRRVRQLVLSPSGRALLDVMRARLREDNPLTTRLSAAEQDQLVGLLRKATAGAGGPPRAVTGR